jgi:hypothetical protein
VSPAVLPGGIGTVLPQLRIFVIANEVPRSLPSPLSAETSLNLGTMDMGKLTPAEMEPELLLLTVALPAPVLTVVFACLPVLWASSR